MAASAKPSQLYAKELGPDCIACLCRQYLSAAPGDAPWELRSAYMRQALSAISEGSRELTAPEIGHKLDGLLREQFGVEEDRTEEKLRLNELVMGWEDDLWRKVVAAKDPVALAARLAACGNYVDFSVQESVEEDVLARFLERAGADEGQGGPFSALSEALLEARSAVLLADNCGEVVLDKMLLRAVKRSNPVCEATVIVRDGRVSGDVTLADAAQVGLGEVARVVSNGNDVAGTCERLLSGEARQVLVAADVVVSKGLANFETLRGRRVATRGPSSFSWSSASSTRESSVRAWVTSWPYGECDSQALGRRGGRSGSAWCTSCRARDRGHSCPHHGTNRYKEGFHGKKHHQARSARACGARCHCGSGRLQR